jgi:probable rRNA maturation factor
MTTVLVETSHRIRRAELQSFASDTQRALKLRGDVSILLTTSNHIQQLNRQYRKKNKATDVLSFPANVSGVAGDLAISVDIAAGYAQQLGHSLTKELSILILHGMIHLAGHDHEIDNGEMAALEAKLRKRFGLPLSLTERSHSARSTT